MSELLSPFEKAESVSQARKVPNLKNLRDMIKKNASA